MRLNSDQITHIVDLFQQDLTLEEETRPCSALDDHHADYLYDLFYEYGPNVPDEQVETEIHVIIAVLDAEAILKGAAIS